MPAIRAAVLLDAGADPQLTEVQIREPVGDEVLVRIDAAGICHTDISVAARWRRPPMVFGHEGAGTVAAAGPDAEARTGQRVVLTFDSCGHCATGRRAYCDRLTDLNMGGRKGDLRDGDGDDAVAVFGAGAVGLSVVMGAKAAGCRTIVTVDPLAPRRKLAAELGASATVDPAITDPVNPLRDLTDGGPVAAVDTTAIPDVLATAITALRARGTLAIVGLGAPTAELPVGLVMGKGLTVRGVVEGDSDPQTFLPHLVDLRRRGDLPLEKLVTAFDFDDFDAAWAAARTGVVVKPVLRTGRYGQ